MIFLVCKCYRARYVYIHIYIVFSIDVCRWHLGGVCRDCDLPSHSNCESGGSRHLVLCVKPPASGSRCSSLRACERLSAIPLLSTQLTSLLLTPRLIISLYFSPSYSWNVETRGHRIPTSLKYVVPSGGQLEKLQVMR